VGEESRCKCHTGQVPCPCRPASNRAVPDSSDGLPVRLQHGTAPASFPTVSVGTYAGSNRAALGSFNVAKFSELDVTARTTPFLLHE
jgi:hypothetical protein